MRVACLALVGSGTVCHSFAPASFAGFSGVANSAVTRMTATTQRTTSPSHTNQKDREEDRIDLGGVKVSPMGIGTWSWGDKIQWGYDESQNDELQKTFNTLVSQGINFFDTAEAYGPETSESLIGKFQKELPKGREDLVLASKFAAMPWRIGEGTVEDALKASLDRMGMQTAKFYQLHWPGFWQNEAYWQGIADCVDKGLIQSVGVCNYAEGDLRKAHKALADRGVKLVSNQIQYSLLHRFPESNGQIKAANDLGVKVIAYSPLGQGLLTGTYSPENPPGGVRKLLLNDALNKMGPIIDALRSIGNKRGKTPAQVALNWVICKGAIPIPGARNVRQAEENVGAMGWRLSSEEVSQLDTASRESDASTPQLGPGN